jgi:hypothetical protein
VGVLLLLGPLYIGASGGLGSFDAWELASLIIAAFLLTAWLVLTIRLRTTGALVLASLLFLPAALGFAAYTAFPGPAPHGSFVFLLSLFAYATALVLTIISIVRRIRPRPVDVTVAAYDRAVTRTLVGRLVVTIWMTALLFTFEPFFALANLALNALWEVVWIPKRWRTSIDEHVTDVAADPKVVFDYISDPAHWPEYRDDVELLDVQPPGRFQVGTRYVVGIPLPGVQRGGKRRRLEITYVISEVVPGESYTATLPDRRGNTATTRVSATPDGSRITVRTETLVPFALASQAGVLGIPAQRAAQSTVQAKRSAALKRILEAAPAQ